MQNEAMDALRVGRLLHIKGTCLHVRTLLSHIAKTPNCAFDYFRSPSEMAK